MNEAPQVPAGVGTGRPTPARIYDYMPQGNNYPYEGAEPGVTFTGLSGAEDVPMADSDGSRWLYCGVARKP